MTYEELQKISAESGIAINQETLAKLHLYAHLLAEWNKTMNLTAIDKEDEIIEKHFYDSIIPAKVFDFHKKALIDVGTGAGFPGLVLAIIFPDLKVTLVDSTKKKFEFLAEVKSQLSLKNVDFINGRAEELKQFREKFDVATARAFSSLDVIIEVCIPLVKVGGTLIAMKSSKADEEIKSSKIALQKLESKIVEEQRDFLPSGHDSRVNIFILKGQKTTPKYPRKWADIVSNPL